MREGQYIKDKTHKSSGYSITSFENKLSDVHLNKVSVIFYIIVENHSLLKRNIILR